MVTSNRRALRIPIIGLEIDFKTDLLAAAAFVLAALAVLAQIYFFVIGAKVKLFLPERVVLFFQENPIDHNAYLQIAARMAYTNLGGIGYNATVYLETVEFRLGVRTHCRIWHSEQQIMVDDDGRLSPRHVSLAGPFPIPAGGTVSREVLFAAFPEIHADGNSPCDNGNHAITANRAASHIQNQEVMTLTFGSYVLGRATPLISSCQIHLGRSMAQKLRRNYWVSPRCHIPQAPLTPLWDPLTMS